PAVDGPAAMPHRGRVTPEPEPRIVQATGEAERPTWPVRRPRHTLALVLVAAVAGLAFLPIGSLAVIALSGDGSSWPHLLRNVLPQSLLTTAHLMLLVALGTAFI